MTALRKVVDSSTLVNIFDLPPAFQNRKVEIVMFPVEEKKDSYFTKPQIEEWANSSEIQVLVGALKTANLPADVSLNDIRNERLTEKYRL